MERLKELRKKSKLNQKQVADVLGLTVSAYGNYELGQREPTIESLCKLADLQSITLSDMIATPLWTDPILLSQKTLFVSLEIFFRTKRFKVILSCIN